MLLAFFLIAFKGVGIGSVHVRYGLYISRINFIDHTHARAKGAALVLLVLAARAARRWCATAPPRQQLR